MEREKQITEKCQSTYTKRIGNTTFKVQVQFAENTTDTIEDKMLHLLTMTNVPEVDVTNKAYTEMSRYVTAPIENEMLQNGIYWIVQLLLWAVTLILFCLPFYFMWKSWKEKILEATNVFTIALSLLLLLIVVYLGEYVKAILSMNLLGLWMIGTIIIIGSGIYVIDCIRYRR
ncbi:MAG: transposon-encoded TnpW family protein [Lachnospiraceae bacterium]|nr:transposon-encoded TnpW family protein [Lachnospiraceae bacterium]